MPGRSPFPAARSIRAMKARSLRRCAKPKRRSGSTPVLIEPIGYLDLYLTFSGFRILPTVARVKPDFTLTLNPWEVTETFEVPLDFLMTPGNHQRKTPRLERHSARLLRHAVRRALHLGRHRGYPAQSLRPDLRRMIRPIFTEIGLFLTPFVIYAGFPDGDARRRAGPGVLDAAPRRRPRHRVASPHDRQLRACWRSSPARRRARPMCRPMSRTASSCRERRDDGRRASRQRRLAQGR